MICRNILTLEIVAALRIHGAEVQLDLEELWRRTAFFVAITKAGETKSVTVLLLLRSN